LGYLVGIDGGGTGCRAAIAGSHGEILGRGKSGSANIMTDLHGALANILIAARAACDDARLTHESIAESRAVLGLAGANIGDYAERVRAALPFRESLIETDATIALHGALGDGDGAVAIIGTGSVFAAREGERIRTVGGWGFMVGDLGSGARVGRALLQEALLAHDGVHPGSPLTGEVLRHFEGDPQSLVEYAHMAKPGEFGTFAPMVFDYAKRGDSIGRSLVEGATRSIEEALDAIMPVGCERLCLLGGLAGLYRNELGARYQGLLREPLGDALSGAVAIARQRFGRDAV
jgi:glucosamine kinase